MSIIKILDTWSYLKHFKTEEKYYTLSVSSSGPFGGPIYVTVDGVQHQLVATLQLSVREGAHVQITNETEAGYDWDLSNENADFYMFSNKVINITCRKTIFTLKVNTNNIDSSYLCASISIYACAPNSIERELLETITDIREYTCSVQENYTIDIEVSVDEGYECEDYNSSFIMTEDTQVDINIYEIYVDESGPIYAYVGNKSDVKNTFSDFYGYSISPGRWTKLSDGSFTMEVDNRKNYIGKTYTITAEGMIGNINKEPHIMRGTLTIGKDYSGTAYLY